MLLVGLSFFVLFLDFVFSFFFFFSSRRRHTRLTCDWSSDVCSSDLGSATCISKTLPVRRGSRLEAAKSTLWVSFGPSRKCATQEPYRSKPITKTRKRICRSEERRVGKECRARGSR